MMSVAVILTGCEKSGKTPWNSKDIVFAAHRGLHAAGVPENSVAAVRLAAKAGYKLFECDVHKTADDSLVIMHDATLNRTCVNIDGTPIEEAVYLDSLNFSQLRSMYKLKSGMPGIDEPVPLFEDLLKAAAECGTYPMIHYGSGNIPDVIRLVRKYCGSNYIFFTSKKDHIRLARECDPSCSILYSISKEDDGVEFLDTFERRGDMGISTMNSKILTRELLAKYAEAGYEVQTSIPSDLALDTLMCNGVTFVLSNYRFPILPERSGYEVLYDNTIANPELDADNVFELDVMDIPAGKVVACNISGTLAGECNVTIPGVRTLPIIRENAGFALGYVMNADHFSLKIECGTSTVSDLRVRLFAID